MSNLTDLPFANSELAQRVGNKLQLVEERLRDAVAYTDDLASATTTHLMDAGGKRVRPMLTLLTAELGDGSRPEVIDAAAVTELTHLATLYHDDVMDSAPLRRGAPSAHEVWGNSVAILTGDLLFARASIIVSRLGPEAVRIQAETFERLCLGQLHESVGPGANDEPIAHYLQVLADKTGSLIATSGRFGAMFSGADVRYSKALIEYGERLGVAFQLADDVIDLSMDGAATGKTPGTDLREGVPTMPTLLLQQLADTGEATGADLELLEALKQDLSSDDTLAEVVEAFQGHRVVRATQEHAQRLAREAQEELHVLPEGEVRSALEDFAQMMVDRAS